MNPNRILRCHLCPFLTDLRHHYTFHMNNHFHVKPFKCDKCNYVCVNKSMLNSHMKTHSSVYPYRCGECEFSSKYLHALNEHQLKHNHKKRIILKSDGSLPDNCLSFISRHQQQQPRGTPSSSTSSSNTPSHPIPSPAFNLSTPSFVDPQRRLMETMTYSGNRQQEGSQDMSMPQFPSILTPTFHPANMLTTDLQRKMLECFISPTDRLEPVNQPTSSSSSFQLGASMITPECKSPTDLSFSGKFRKYHENLIQHSSEGMIRPPSPLGQLTIPALEALGHLKNQIPALPWSLPKMPVPSATGPQNGYIVPSAFANPPLLPSSLSSQFVTNLLEPWKKLSTTTVAPYVQQIDNVGASIPPVPKLDTSPKQSPEIMDSQENEGPLDLSTTTKTVVKSEDGSPKPTF